MDPHQLDRVGSNPLFANAARNGGSSGGADRGAAPIPEEHARKLPRLPSAPMPTDDNEAAHAEFERARMEAAQKRELKKPKSRFAGFFPSHGPTPPPTPPPPPHAGDEESGLTDAAVAVAPPATPSPQNGSHNQAGNRTSFRRFLPKLPSSPANHTVSQDDHDEFDRQKKAAEERKRRFPHLRIGAAPLPPAAPPPPDGHVDDSHHEEFDRLKQAAEKRRGNGVASTSPLARAASFTNRHSFFGPNKPKLAGEEEPDDGTAPIDAKPPPAEKHFATWREYFAYEIKYRHLLERMLMAGLAVSLLWMTSLAVCRSIVHAQIVGPEMRDVVVRNQKALNTTFLESDLYATCTERLVFTCNASFTADLGTEVTRSKLVLAKNRLRLDNVTALRFNCSSSFGNVVSVINYMVSERGMSLQTYATKNLTTDPMCINLQQTVANQMAAIRAHNQGEVFQLQGDELVGESHSVYAQRLAYDASYNANLSSYAYQVGLNLNAMVGDPAGAMGNVSDAKGTLYACSGTGPPTNATCNTTSLLNKVAIMRANIVSQYQNQRDAFKANMDSTMMQFEPMRNFYQNFQNAMGGISGVASSLNAAANNNGGGGSGLEGIGYKDIDPSLGPFPTLPPGSSFSTITPSTTGVKASGDSSASGMDAANANTTGNWQASTNKTKEGHLSWQAKFMSDYNPPPFDLAGEVSAWHETTTGYLPSIQSDLSLVSKPVDSQEPAQSYQPTSNSSAAGDKADSLLNSTVIQPEPLYAYDNIDPNVMLFQWDTIVNLAVAMDYVFRAMYSLIIIYYYWNLSSVTTPPGDVRSMRGGNIKANAMPKTPEQLIIKILANPWFGILLIIIFLSILVKLFLGIYMPFFDDYAFGCVTENADQAGFERNGTMMTRNAYTVALAWSFSKGDGISTTEIDRVNVQRELVCGENEQSTFNQQKLYAAEYTWNDQKMDELKANVDEFRYCLNASKIDLELGPEFVLNGTNQTSSSFSQNLLAPKCDVAWPVLDPSTFNCSAIKVCMPTCTGPIPGLIQLSTYNAGCTTEYYLHAGILGGALAFFVFVMLNLSRWIFMRALRRLLHSHFATGDYSYIGTTNEHGVIEYPEEVTEDGRPFKELVAERLHNAIKAYERQGWYFMAVAVLFNVPWIFALVYFGSRLRFQQGN